MRPKDRATWEEFEANLRRFSEQVSPLPGIADAGQRRVLLTQLIDSTHRVAYPRLIATRQLSSRSANPTDVLFDPIKAAIVNMRRGNLEEACWLIFLFVHFGKHLRAGWRYVREVYGRGGQEECWNWDITSSDVPAFRDWLHGQVEHLKRPGEPHGFGNHRKYESLDAYSDNGTGQVIASYVDWVSAAGSHTSLLNSAVVAAGRDPRAAFDALYRSMAAVARFGRTAKFDYLTMLGKLSFAAIEPGFPYLQGATGPLAGAKLLFGVPQRRNATTSELDSSVVQLGDSLGVGMQVMEDALCNWQKSPTLYRRFGG